MTTDPSGFRCAAGGFELRASRVPWDEAAFGFPVASIDHIRVSGGDGDAKGFASFEAWRLERDIAIVSCRLPESSLNESMFLENHGFRYIETTLSTRFDAIVLPGEAPAGSGRFEVGPARRADFERLRSIAETAFGHQRYHVDPRIDSNLANDRYARWVDNTIGHPVQELLAITSDGGIVGIFVVERLDDRSVYWHLTALAPCVRGKGLAKGAWRAVLAHHAAEGVTSVFTRISVRNTPALNLYASLRFSLGPPEMTFHWIAEHVPTGRRHRE